MRTITLYFLGCIALSIALTCCITTSNNSGASINHDINRLNFNWTVVMDESEATNPTAYLLNSEYIYSNIGIDYSKLGQYQLGQYKIITHKPLRDSAYVFNGKAFDSYSNIEAPLYKPTLVSLSDIKQVYAPQVKQSECIFMVDDYVLMKNLSHYKFDKDYIDTVIVVPKGDVSSIDRRNRIALSIIHIYTKEKRYRTATSIANISLNTHDYEDVNNSERAVFLNGKYIQSFIGINTDSLATLGDTKCTINRVSDKEQKIGTYGRKFTTELRIESKKYRPKMITLREVLSKYRINAYEPLCLFLINEIPVTKDLEDLRIDEDYICAVKAHYPFSIERLNGGVYETLTVVRIFVKDKETLKESRGRVVWGNEMLLYYE